MRIGVEARRRPLSIFRAKEYFHLGPTLVDRLLRLCSHASLILIGLCILHSTFLTHSIFDFDMDVYVRRDLRESLISSARCVG